MTISMPFWAYIGLLLLGLIAILAILVLLDRHSLNKKTIDKVTGAGKMIAEIQGHDGFPKRHLVAINPDGMTVTINKGIYRLNEARESQMKKNGDYETEENESIGDKVLKSKQGFPNKRFDYYPSKPFMGVGAQKVLRLESWQEGNPEPIKPFYGMFVDASGMECDPMEEGAKFVDSRLIVTATEVNNLQRVSELAQAASEAEEIKASLKSFQRFIANMPSKTLVIILGLGGLLVSGITLVLVFGLKSAFGV